MSESAKRNAKPDADRALVGRWSALGRLENWALYWGKEHMGKEHMELIEMQSTDIKRAGFEYGRLRVVFVRGGTYEYSGVPRVLWVGLQAAESKGKYLHKYIKGGGYRFVRVEGE